MNITLKLSDIELEVDGAEGGRVWIFGNDDEMIHIKKEEIHQVIDFLTPLI